jgi:zinc transport system substrate-binding protein
MKYNKFRVVIVGSVFIIVLGLILIKKIYKPLVAPAIKDNKLKVIASFYPMYYFASQIVGIKADVYNITPASAEPHDYEPTTQQIVKISQSNMLVLNGGIMEAWGNKIKDQLTGSKVLVVTAGEGLINNTVNENGQNILDPHVYMDPVLAKKQVTTIEKGFEKIDPKDAQYFQTNAKKLEGELDQLNKEFKQGLSNCNKNDFITSHAAFGYLAFQYGINQVSISGVSPDEEPSSLKLAEITQLVKQKDIKIIFFESLVSPKLSETIANETGAKIMVLDPIEGITTDGIKAGHTYFTIMRDNLTALQDALQCNK